MLGSEDLDARVLKGGEARNGVVGEVECRRHGDVRLGVIWSLFGWRAVGGEARLREGPGSVQLPEGKRRILWTGEGCRQLKQRREESRGSDRYCGPLLARGGAP